MDLVVVSEEAVEALPLGRPLRADVPQAPLAEAPGGVALLPEQLGDGGLLVGQRDPAGVPPERHPAHVLAGHQDRSSRGADGAAGVGLGEADPLGRQPVQVGGGDGRSPVASQIGVAQVVGHHEDDVGPLGIRPGRERRAGRPTGAGGGRIVIRPHGRPGPAPGQGPRLSPRPRSLTAAGTASTIAAAPPPGRPEPAKGDGSGAAGNGGARHPTMNQADGRLLRLGVFFDGNFLFHVSNYYPLLASQEAPHLGARTDGVRPEPGLGAGGRGHQALPDPRRPLLPGPASGARDRGAAEAGRRAGLRRHPRRSRGGAPLPAAAPRRRQRRRRVPGPGGPRAGRLQALRRPGDRRRGHQLHPPWSARSTASAPG